MRAETSLVVELVNENSLSTYNLADGASLILENLSNGANQCNAHDQDFNCRTEVSK